MKSTTLLTANPRCRLWYALAALTFVAPVFGQPAVKCVVHDAELQSSYSGSCKDGLAEGRGEASGVAQYQGEFKAGRKQGKGVKTWPSGDRYEGDFVEDRKEGRGTYTWGRSSMWAGEQYTGDYRNDRRHGQGVYTWPGGDRYAGPWENDVITGAATPGMIARTRAYAERAAAVGKSGTRVCREFTVGLVTRDRVRGTVVAAEGDRIAVRIEDAGRFEHTIGNALIAKGAMVWDALAVWAPCHG